MIQTTMWRSNLKRQLTGKQALPLVEVCARTNALLREQNLSLKSRCAFSVTTIKRNLRAQFGKDSVLSKTSTWALPAVGATAKSSSYSRSRRSGGSRHNADLPGDIS